MIKLNKVFFLCLFVFGTASLARATDQGDYLIHAVESWNNNLEVFQTRTVFSYSFVNDFSVGAAFEINKFYKSPALSLGWHLEPFELSAEAGPLFWDYQGERHSAFQFSIYANYLWQMTTHFQLLFSAGINLPNEFFRGVPLGLGFRYWF